MAKAEKQTLGSLEIGRFVAASIVVLTHFCTDMPRFGTGPAAKLFAGISLPTPLAVEFFFVLSGFVMMTAHRKDFGILAAVPRFWWRRACRIYPMYWLSFSVVAYYLYHVLTLRSGAGLILLAPRPTMEFVSPAWTLRYEMAFYIAFGLCLLPYAGRALLALWVLAVFWLWRPPALAHFLVCPPTDFLRWFSYHWAPLFFAPFEFLFFAGLAAGLFRPHNTRTGIAAIAAGIVLLIWAGPACQWGFSYGGSRTSIVTGLGLGLVILGCATLERSGAWRFGNWARKLGTISYPLYILHTSLMTLTAVAVWQYKPFHGAQYAAFGIAYVTILFGVSAAIAFLIDKPLQRALRRIG